MLLTFCRKSFVFTSLFFLATTLQAKPKVKISIWADEGTPNVVTKRLNEFKAVYSKEANFDFTVVEQTAAFCSSNLAANPELAADVFVFADDQLLELSENKLLLEIPGEYVQKVYADCGGAESGAVAAASVNGQLYAFPQLAGNGYFLFYNKNYFSSSDVTSIEKLLDVAAKNGKKVAMDLKNGWYLYSFFKAAGLDVYRVGTKNFCNWNATDTKYKGIDVAKSIVKIASNPGFTCVSNEELLPLLADGSVVAAVSGTWNASYISSLWGKDYGAVKLPTVNISGDDLQMYGFAGYKMVGVKAVTKEAYWALKVAEWLSSQETQLAICKEKGECPANVNATQNQLVKKSPAIAAMAEQARYSSTQRIGGKFWNPALMLGVVLSGGRNLSDKDLQLQLDSTVRQIKD